MIVIDNYSAIMFFKRNKGNVEVEIKTNNDQASNNSDEKMLLKAGNRLSPKSPENTPSDTATPSPPSLNFESMRLCDGHQVFNSESIKPADKLVWNLNYEDAKIPVPTDGSGSQAIPEPNLTQLATKKDQAEDMVNGPLDDGLWSLNYKEAEVKLPVNGSSVQSPPLPQLTELATKKEGAENFVNEPLDDALWRVNYSEDEVKNPVDRSCSRSPRLPQETKFATQKEKMENMVNEPIDDLAWKLKYHDAGAENPKDGFCSRTSPPELTGLAEKKQRFKGKVDKSFQSLVNVR